MRVGAWKIVADEELNRFELYNLKDDREETAELSSRHPEKFEEMKAILIKHDAEVKAEGPDWWKHDDWQPPGRR